jgi:hypothetical protein
MAIVNKKRLYFDVLSRTDKSLMLWSLADATINARNKHVDKIATRGDVANELTSSLDNIRTTSNHAYGDTIGSGTYNGTLKQFSSQYTPGLEFAVWKSTKSSFELTTLAEELQKGNITNEEYISIVMFNYIQIIDGKIVSILKESVESAFTNANHYLTVNDIYSHDTLINQAYLATCDAKTKKKIKESCRLLFNVLSETIYFTKISEDEIQYNGDAAKKDELINAIDSSMLTASTAEELEEVLADLSEQQFYAEYITRTPKELVDYLSKHYSKIITPNVVAINDLQTPVIVNENVTLQEDVTKPNIPVKPFSYTGRTRKTDFIERTKRQSRIGKAAERIVYENEVERIRKIDPSLVDRVIWVSNIYGDGAGYDIQSIDIDPSGVIRDKYIEVKATSCSKNTPIEVTRNEVECSKHFPNEYVVYRLYDFKPSDNVFKYYTLVGDLTNVANARLEPTSFRMFF